MLFPLDYGSHRVRGRAALRLEDGTFLGDDAWMDHSGPGSTVTYKGVRYEIVRCLWISVFTPSSYIVKEFHHGMH